MAAAPSVPGAAFLAQRLRTDAPHCNSPERYPILVRAVMGALPWLKMADEVDVLPVGDAKVTFTSWQT
jgi:hypothetical protein